ncbi:MAG: hypothetical protein SXU28_13500 [Pseudomonadota bacterium]|nr:hypothetical protein [Pseudomonadota bacterium]
MAIILAQPALANAPGQEAEPIRNARSLDANNGAVILSFRSELYLIAKMELFFLREGGDPANAADVYRFSRKEGGFSLGGNSTTKYKVRAYQLPAGRYRLVAHGAKCTKVPSPNERCIADVRFAGIGETVSFPSRGYGEDAPVFEVRAGALTNAGDFALTARNTIEWSVIPPKKLSKIAKQFASIPTAPQPNVSQDYLLKYPLRPRSMSDDRGRRY